MLAVGLRREAAEAMDAADALASYRERFDLPADTVYLNGNSLGPPPRAAHDALNRAYQEWSEHLVGGWTDAGWMEAPVRVGDKIGRLIGAAPGQVVAVDSTSINIYKLLSAALDQRPGRRVILTQGEMFPTDVYIARRVAALRGLELREVDRALLSQSVTDECAVLLLMHVDYRSAHLHDLAELTAAAHAHGALMLADLCHSVAAMPIDLDGWGVDLAVGCTYKFMNGGPGAPAFLYVRRDLHDQVDQPLTGWMGRHDPFGFGDAYDPAPGVGRFQVGTPPILAYASLEAAVDLWLEVDLEVARAKSVALGQLMIDLVDARLAGAGVEVKSPRDAASRGSQVSLTHAEARKLEAALIKRRVWCDHRPPDILRFGLAPLYNRYVEVWDAVDVLAGLLGRA